MVLLASARTEDQLITRREIVRARFEGRNARIETISDLRRNRNIVHIPPKMVKDVEAAGGPHRAPHVMFLIRATQGLLGARLPRAKREPADLKKYKAQHVSSTIEKWFNLGAWPMMFRRVLPQMTDSMAESGWGVLKVRYSKLAWGEALKDEDEKADPKAFNKRARQIRRDNWPWAAECVDPRTFCPIFRDGALHEVFEITRRDASQVADKYGDELRAAGEIVDEWADGTVDDVECTEHWVKDEKDPHDCHFTLMVGDHIVKTGTTRTRTGRPPYYVALFSPTNSRDPAFMTETISDPIIHSQQRLERWLTMKDRWAQKVMAPIFKLTPRGEDAGLGLPEDEEKLVIEWEEEETTNVPLGYEWEQQVIAGTGNDMNQMWQYLVQVIDDHSLAPVLLGKNTGRISTATQHGQIQLAKNIFGVAMEEITAVFDDMGADMLWDIDVDLGIDVPVKIKTSGAWLEIGPDDIDGDYHMTHLLKPVIKMEAIIDAQWLQSGLQNQLLTKAYVQEHGYDIEDPEEMGDAVTVDRIADGPQADLLIWSTLLKDMQADMEPPPPSPEELAGLQTPGPPPGAFGAPPPGAGMAGVGMPMNPGDQRPLIAPPAPALGNGMVG